MRTRKKKKKKTEKKKMGCYGSQMIQLFPQKVVIFSKGISVVHKSNKLKVEN